MSAGPGKNDVGLREALLSLEKGDIDAAKKQIGSVVEINRKLDTYLDDFSSAPSPYVKELCELAQTTDWKKLYEEGTTKVSLIPGMCAGAHESVVLQSFARMMKAKNILEIGMFTGSTTLALANVPSVQQVVTLDIEPYLETLVKPYWDKAGKSDIIKPMFGDGPDLLKQLANEKAQFDYVFIDADKAGYITYCNMLLEHNLLAPGGVILVDNTVRAGSVALDISKLDMSERMKQNAISVQEFNKHIRNDPRVHVSILPINDGITVVQRV